MTYLALARKWRPRTFADVVGQTHVVRALQNALTSGRVHHAFLFTGTRGVGKTTIARILVKALNCETGVTATPCGQCRSCKAIDEGRFVDFVELDAASRTGVDDTRELLENAQYTPAAARFKVYLIDEVHMLSKSAFNALLKTLEEPPGHVKFLLATTDPQKIPVTVLSRCLQFNLKRLPATLIAERVAAVCSSEDIPAEPAAVARIARAGEGSLRDALSLLDQALAFGNGSLRDADVAEMLGSLDLGRVSELLEVLAGGDARAVLAQVRTLDETAPDYEDVLAKLATLVQQIAVIQMTGPDVLGDTEALSLLAKLADTLPPETVQLMYQILVLGRRDLPLAPEPRAGFEMCLLRVLAFQPDAALDAAPAGRAAAPAAMTSSPASQAFQVSPGSRAASTVRAASSPSTASSAAQRTDASRGASGGEQDIRDWPAFVESLALDGAVRQLASHCALAGQSPFELRLSLNKRSSHLLTDSLKGRLVSALTQRLGSNVRVQFAIEDEALDTAADRQARDEEDELRKARDIIAADDNVRQMAELLGAEVVPDSVRRVPGGSSEAPGRAGSRKSPSQRK